MPPTATAPLGRELVSRPPVATIEREFAPNTTAPAGAREVVDVLDGILEPRMLDSLRQVVSELVANAVQHGSPEPSAGVMLRIFLFPTVVSAVVEDNGPGFAAPPRVPGEGAVRGWGLHLVHELADRFGVESGSPNSVWCEIDRRRRGLRSA
jgi:anti-sigma regulatory factor (Ser/Thr protein kinase)